MISRLSYCLAFACLLTVLQPTPVNAASDEDVERARKQGMQFLIDSQLEDGSWEYPKHEVGITALCAMALIENGLPIDDPVIEKAHRYVHSNYLSTTSTYDISLAILLLSRVGDRDNRHAIRDLAARLVAGQNAEGGWGYSCPKVRSIYLTGGGERPAPPKGPGDNSCTQFAVLGLWVASRWGINIDQTMEKVAERFVRDQNEDGGWPYKVDVEMPQSSRNSMTFAGLFCVTVARANQIRARQLEEENAKAGRSTPSRSSRTVPRRTTRPTTSRPAETTEDAAAAEEAPEPVVDPGSNVKTLEEDPVFSKGLQMATKYAAGIGPRSSRYYLWSIERMGVILGMERFGTTDWFEKGASALLSTQGKPGGENEGTEGAWTPPGTGSALSDTSFAILFLRKANLGSDITRLLEGEPLKPFQIVSQEEEPRFLRLEEAIVAARPGDVIRVDRTGTISVPHLSIDKDLTLEAGFGYSPVLTYELGFDSRGIRSNPERDPTARYILEVKGATLVLEGFSIQMDPPRLRGDIPWAAVQVSGGTLRMLNCSVSEGNRQGMASVVVTGPSKVEIRNSLLVGGRAAIEVLTDGEQLVDVDNSVLFSNIGIAVKKGPEADANASVKLELERAVVQAPAAFDFTGITTPIEIESQGVAYTGESIGKNFLADRTSKTARSWTGKDNVYDVRFWVGYQGNMLSSIKDEKTWSSFWGDTDVSPVARVVSLAGNRRHGAFTHEVRGDDFEFSSTSQIYSMRRTVGINPLVIGPDYGYVIFREGYDYSAWKSGEAALASAEIAVEN